MPGFFSRLSYSFGNEDWETERRALQASAGDRTICVTGSGDRALHCLLTDSAEIISIDANPIQNHLLQLKCAALNQLDFGSYLGFLGIQALADRAEHLRTLAPSMPASSASFWLGRTATIDKGIIYQGHVERICSIVARVMSKLRGKKVQRLFDADHLDDQREIVDREWNTWTLRKVIEIIFHPIMAKRILKDPGTCEHGPGRFLAGRYIHDRMNGYLQRHLARESLLFSMIFLGEVLPEGLPPYLQRTSAATIKKRLGRLQIETGNIIQYLENAPEASIDRFSLSDIASYMDAPHFYRLLAGVCRTAKPGARFCIRQFLSDHPLPAEFSERFIREPELETKLEESDRCFVYRYMVGHIAS